MTTVREKIEADIRNLRLRVSEVENALGKIFAKISAMEARRAEADEEAAMFNEPCDNGLKSRADIASKAGKISAATRRQTTEERYRSICAAYKKILADNPTMHPGDVASSIRGFGAETTVRHALRVSGIYLKNRPPTHFTADDLEIIKDEAGKLKRDNPSIGIYSMALLIKKKLGLKCSTTHLVGVLPP